MFYRVILQLADGETKSRSKILFTVVYAHVRSTSTFNIGNDIAALSELETKRMYTYYRQQHRFRIMHNA